MSVALIFGANGQDAHYLRESLRQDGHEVISVSRTKGDWMQGNVADFSFVEELVRKFKPSYAFHLAARSTTAHEALFENHETIATGTLNLLESLERHHPTCKVFVAGSGVQFENDGSPISENSPFAPASPYAVARIHSVMASRYYRARGLQTYVGYLFHHESPLRKPGHVSQTIAQAARAAARGEKVDLVMGDLSVEKEWTFAGDVVQGMRTLIDQDDIAEAAIGCGETHSIQDWAAACFSAVGRDFLHYVREEGDFKAEYPKLVSDPSTMFSLGWRPVVKFDELANMMVSDL